MTQEGPIFRYERTGFAFEVHPNRIDISDTSGFGAKMTGGKQESILARNIAGVEVKGLTRKLTITTNDGTKHEFILGTESEKARKAILSIL